jgi:hypothetical protein
MSTDIATYTPGAESWDSLVASSDEVLGHELVSGEAADKLIGVPFISTRVAFREGVQRAGAPYRDDYVSCEALVAPQNVLAERARRGRLDLDEISVDPGEHIIFNDGSSGIYRQIVHYLESKGLIKLPEGPDTGGKGESRFDLPRSQWDEGEEDGTDGINIRLLCPRGLHYSEYSNEYTQDGKTRYIA